MRRGWILAVSAALGGVSVSVVGQGKPETASDRLATEYMNAIEQVLNETPSDGRFGLARVGTTIHGHPFPSGSRESALQLAYAALDRHHPVSVGTHGRFDRQGNPTRSRRDLVFANGAMRVTKPAEANEKLAEFTQELAQLSADLMRSGKRDSRRSLRFAERTIYVDARTILAKRECLTCHAGIQPGKPIGVVTVLRMPEEMRISPRPNAAPKPRATPRKS